MSCALIKRLRHSLCHLSRQAGSRSASLRISFHKVRLHGRRYCEAGITSALRSPRSIREAYCQAIDWAYVELRSLLPRINIAWLAIRRDAALAGWIVIIDIIPRSSVPSRRSSSYFRPIINYALIERSAASRWGNIDSCRCLAMTLTFLSEMIASECHDFINGVNKFSFRRHGMSSPPLTMLGINRASIRPISLWSHTHGLVWRLSARSHEDWL